MTGMDDSDSTGLPEQVWLQVVVGDSEMPATYTMGVQGLDEHGFSVTTTDAEAMAALTPGTALRASYGDHSGLCRFDSVVVSQTAGEPTIVVIDPPRKIAIEQRRRFVRAEVDMPVACALLDASDEPTFVAAIGNVGNLGAGGLRMAIGNHPALVKGATMSLALDLVGAGQPVVVMLARVVDVTGPYFEDGEVIVRLVFTMVESDDRERLERFVYRKLGGIAPAKTYSAGKITQISP